MGHTGPDGPGLPLPGPPLPPPGRAWPPPDPPFPPPGRAWPPPGPAWPPFGLWCWCDLDSIFWPGLSMAPSPGRPSLALCSSTTTSDRDETRRPKPSGCVLMLQRATFARLSCPHNNVLLHRRGTRGSAPACTLSDRAAPRDGSTPLSNHDSTCSSPPPSVEIASTWCTTKSSPSCSRIRRR